MIFVVREPRPFILEVKKTWTSFGSQNELMIEMRLRIRNHRILVHCLSINFMCFWCFSSVFIICSYVLWFCVSMLSHKDPINPSTVGFYGLYESLHLGICIFFKRRVQRNITRKITNDPWWDFFLQSGYFLCWERVFPLCLPSPMFSLLQTEIFDITIQ